MILRGELAAGERLTEDRLAEQLGVSRNPVREAIRSLEATGLVEVIPRKGAYVCRHDLEDVQNLLELRTALESFAAEMVARTAPSGLAQDLSRIIDGGVEASELGNHVLAAELHRDFHLAIEQAIRNPYLLQVVEPLRHRTEMVFSILLESRGAVSWNEHQRIRDAIADEDPGGARRAIADHMSSVLRELRRLEEQGSEAS